VFVVVHACIRAAYRDCVLVSRCICGTRSHAGHIQQHQPRPGRQDATDNPEWVRARPLQESVQRRQQAHRARESIGVAVEAWLDTGGGVKDGQSHQRRCAVQAQPTPQPAETRARRHTAVGGTRVRRATARSCDTPHAHLLLPERSTARRRRRRWRRRAGGRTYPLERREARYSGMVIPGCSSPSYCGGPRGRSPKRLSRRARRASARTLSGSHAPSMPSSARSAWADPTAPHPVPGHRLPSVSCQGVLNRQPPVNQDDTPPWRGPELLGWPHHRTGNAPRRSVLPAPDRLPAAASPSPSSTPHRALSRSTATAAKKMCAAWQTPPCARRQAGRQATPPRRAQGDQTLPGAGAALGARSAKKTPRRGRSHRMHNAQSSLVRSTRPFRLN
jgi:hypothetical protein